MKVYIGPFSSFIGPYQIADTLKVFGVSEEKCDAIGEKLANTWVSTFCNWVESKRKRTVKVKIHAYDTWNIDSTLSYIVLPMLIKLQKEKHKQLIEQENKHVKDVSNFKKIDVKSQKINEEIKEIIFKKIFKILDTQERNIIEGSTVDLSVLPENIKKIVEPLILELKEQNESLTGEEFVMACEHLFRVINIKLSYIYIIERTILTL